jgi:hypothetical protein
MLLVIALLASLVGSSVQRERLFASETPVAGGSCQISDAFEATLETQKITYKIVKSIVNSNTSVEIAGFRILSGSADLRISSYLYLKVERHVKANSSENLTPVTKEWLQYVREFSMLGVVRWERENSSTCPTSWKPSFDGVFAPEGTDANSNPSSVSDPWLTDFLPWQKMGVFNLSHQAGCRYNARFIGSAPCNLNLTTWDPRKPICLQGTLGPSP